MSTGTNPGSSSSHPEPLNEIERLKAELQVLKADLDKQKGISDRAIHYKHETRRRTIQRNILALVVLLLITCVIYLKLAGLASGPQPGEEEIPNIEALVPDAENGESSGEE